MPTARLSGAGPAYLPARPITLIVEQESSGPPIELVVSAEDDVRRPKQGMVIVPAVHRPLTVGVRLARGGAFPSPTVLHLSAVVTDANGGDQDRVLVPSVSVGGLPFAELVILERAGTNVAVRRPQADEIPVLSEAGNAALLAARSRLAVSRLPEADRRDLRVVVDASASMATTSANGSLGYAIDLLTGVAAIVGRETTLDTVVAATPPRHVPAEPAELAAAVTRQLAGAAYGNGFVVGDAVRPGSAATCTYVVSDSVPADHEALDPSYHLVLLADASCAGVVAPMCNMTLSVVDRAPAAKAGVDQIEVAHIVDSLLTVLGGAVPR